MHKNFKTFSFFALEQSLWQIVFSCTVTILLIIFSFIIVYTQTRGFEYLFLISGIGVGDKFNRPSDIAIDPETGDVLIADQNKKRIVIFNEDGIYRTIFRNIGSLKTVDSLDVDKNGDIYFCSEINDSFGLMNYRGNLIEEKKLKTEETILPSKIRIKKEKIYILDRRKMGVFVFDKDGYFLYKIIENKEKKQPYFVSPLDIRIDNKERLYVSDQKLRKIFTFDKAGNFITKFGEPGTEFGQLNFPFGLAIDSKGLIFVVDSQRFAVLSYNPDNKYKMVDEFGGPVYGRHIGIGKDNKIYIIDINGFVHGFKIME